MTDKYLKGAHSLEPGELRTNNAMYMDHQVQTHTPPDALKKSAASGELFRRCEPKLNAYDTITIYSSEYQEIPGRAVGEPLWCTKLVFRVESIVRGVKVKLLEEEVIKPHPKAVKSKGKPAKITQD